MKSVILLFACVFLTTTLADTIGYTIGYDHTYDNASESLSKVACSDGKHGLMHLGFKTLGDLPSFPFIGAAASVKGWDSSQCGTCWKFTYEGRTVTVLAVDHTDNEFTLSSYAMDDLTGGQAAFVGTVGATAEQVDKSACGL
ncbi:immunomodulatory protein [Artomyces pyxidatus]|uniref:Immunomodulatory protein n=1 Tax=Artomyces pyxidatus TaxID=48021 RepID=A0ACB8SXE3_9AGAM|nr:immunomodulatory protein [Artomyces pyxidatus]